MAKRSSWLGSENKSACVARAKSSSSALEPLILCQTLMTNLMGAKLKRAIGRGGIPSHKLEALNEGKLLVESGGRRWRLKPLMGKFKIANSALAQLLICADIPLMNSN